MAQEVTAKFKVDISDLKKGIQEANRQIRLANAEFRAVSAGMDDWQHSTEGVQKKIDQLQNVIASQKTILENYKAQLALIVQEYGEGSREADEMRIRIANQQAQVNANERSLRQYTETLAGLQGAEAGSASSAEQQAEALATVQNAVEKAGAGFTAFKDILTNFVATGVKAAIDGLKALASTAKDAWQEYDKGRDAVIKATGATGEAAQEITDSFAEVAKTVGGDLETIGSAVGEVNTRFGFTGTELEDASRKFLKFAKVTGTDATTAVQLVSRAMGDAGIASDDYAELLDELATAGQASGISIERLTELLTKYGAPMRALGFETKDAIAMFSKWEKEGVNIELAFSGMRNAIGKWSREGKDAKKEFQSTLDTIASAKSITEATGMAIAAFGQRAGTDLADAIYSGRFEYQSFLDLIEGSEGAVENTLAGTADATDKVKLAFQNVRVTLAQSVDTIVQKYSPEIVRALDKILPVVQDVIQWVGENVPPMIDGIMSAFEQLAPVISGVFDEIMPPVKSAVETIGTLVSKIFQWIIDNSDTVIAALAGIGAAIVAWNVATVVAGVVQLVQAIRMMGAAAAFAAAKQWLLNTALLANPIGLVVAAIAGLVAAFAVLWKRSEAFRDFWRGLWDEIQQSAEFFIDSIVKFYTGAWDKIKTAWATASGFFTEIFGRIKKNADDSSSMVRKTWGAVSGFFTRVFSGIRGNAEKAFTNVKSAFTNLSYAIKKIFQPTIDFITAGWRIIAEIAEGCLKAIRAVWGGLSAWFRTAVSEPITRIFSAVWNTVTDAANAAWAKIKTAWGVVSAWFRSTVADPVASAFSTAWDAITGTANTAWNKIRSVWATVSGWFRSSVIEPVSGFFTGMWENLKSGAAAAWDGIKSVFSHVSTWFRDVFAEAWQKVKDVFSTGGKVFDGIKEGIVESFKTVVNAIIRGINKVISVPFNAINGMLDKLRDLEIAGVQPFDGLVTRLPVPEIPELERGGVLKRGQVGLLEGNGAEAVVPLERNRAWIAATAAQLRREMAANGMTGAGVSASPTYTFNQYNSSPKALSRLEIYRQSKNLMRMLGGA